MSDQTKDQQTPSTLQSYVNSATGAVQSALGGLTGNTTQQAEGQVTQEQAKTEHEQSQAGIKAGGVSVSSDGGVAKDSADRSDGSWNQTIGSAKEALGGLVGHDGLKKAGRQQNLEGQQQEAKGQLNDLAGGVSDRAKGVVGGAMATAMGDESGKAHYDQLRADGKAAQRGVEADLEKRAEAEQAEQAKKDQQ
ncbi:CsbD-like protein [Cordyceps fumosorosea ARSEF 2679]|uniref:CsbD-like protein n=1 Tax=Cordyceps fumosorosea (strain ARSEF 2679) TaxID=1081104 RepID=A0A168B1Z9_CORFA|nr:CsbD-like protein [Cordyceps fumosorosea ARSEF 2679]OAA69505.1 CsbD-like protein [Cordyceps fumosorosea ARSEF 2679]